MLVTIGGEKRMKTWYESFCSRLLSAEIFRLQRVS